MPPRDVPVVLLAAGRSTRMRGRDKLLEPVGGEPLLRRQARLALEVSNRVHVVIPAGEEARARCLTGLPVRLVHPPEEAPMSASLAAGVAAVADAPAFLLMLADMPEIEAADLARLVETWRAEPGAIVRAAAENGRPGHPLIFPAALFAALRRLEGDRGARTILRDPPCPVRLVPLPGRRALVDLDTPEDWEAWRTGRS